MLQGKLKRNYKEKKDLPIRKFVLYISEFRCSGHQPIAVTDLGKKVKVKLSRYRPGVAHRVGTVIALLFHDRGGE